MNCDTLRRRLLADEKPDQPTADAKRHLAECPSCRVWQRRLVRIEQDLPLVPVPESAAGAECVRRVLEAPPPEPHALPEPEILVRVAAPLPARERGLRKTAFAFALTAALVVFAVGLWAWLHRPGPTPPPDPVLARRAARDERLARAPTTRAQVELLADMADEVQKETRTLVQSSGGDRDKLALLSRFFVELVRDDLMAHVERLPVELRPGVLDKVAARLQEMESALTQLKSSSARLDDRPLEEMALAARASHDRLLALLRDSA